MKLAVFHSEQATLRSRILQAAIIFCCWTVVALISLTRHYMVEVAQPFTRPIWQILPIWLSCYYSWAVLTPAVFSVAKRWPLSRRFWGTNFLIHLPLSLVFTSVAIYLSRAADLLLEHGSLAGLNDYMVHLHFVSFLKHFPFYWSTLIVANILASFRALREKERLAAQLELERSQLESSLRQAQLDALRMQLNPHFLFNTLQTISVLMMDDTASANRMLVRLSDLFVPLCAVPSIHCLFERRSLFFGLISKSSKSALPIGSRVNWNVQSRCRTCTCTHAIASAAGRKLYSPWHCPDVRAGIIAFQLRRRQSALPLCIGYRTGFSTQPERNGHGIGLRNTRKRLKQLYPGHDMDIMSGPQGGFEVRMSIPLVLTMHRTLHPEEWLAQ